MQIDFHHAVTYVCCRLGGMNHEDASVVAHAAQYVDDATNDGPLNFKTGERYVRATSAHRMLDPSNADCADNRLVWVPFHFLPGNDIPPQGMSAADAFIHRMVCRPDSQIAREMVFDCIHRQDAPYGLHRLGVALHTYVDTWAHQAFVGMVNDFNKVDSISVVADPAYKDTQVYMDLTSGATKAKAYIAGVALPVGHAGVLTFPDLPFARWSFKRANGEVVLRDNPASFLAAAKGMFNMVRRYVAQDVTLPSTEMQPQDATEIETLLRTTIAVEPEDRHKVWKKAIAVGKFSFGAEQIDYIEGGKGSWKHIALGKDPDMEDEDEEFSFVPEFLDSHWKKFHDAVQYHRMFILHDLLPRHGIVAS